MAGFYLHTSNRLERLFDAFGSIIRDDPLASPFDRETVIVQSKGMERWLSLRIAQDHGICANMAFPFPNAFVDSVFSAILPELPTESPFNPGQARWRLMKIIAEGLDEPCFRMLADYLAGDLNGLKLTQLGEKLADLFDQYALFRPDWIRKWEAGLEAAAGDVWQAELWRRLSGGIGTACHRPALMAAFAERIRSREPLPGSLPRRVSLFGISALPPFHLDVFQGLAAWMDVHFFMLDPCREYWRDLVSETAAVSAEARTGLPPEALHLEKGHPLLVSLGGLNRDFAGLLEARDPQLLPAFEEPAGASLLERLQKGVLENRVPPATEPEKLNPGDLSIRVHSCHSPMREVEAIYDSLLELVERTPGLAPEDILVMAPDISLYAPFIRAVFGTPEEERLRLPFTVSDRVAREASPLVRAFFSLLRLERSRYSASAVMAVLEAPSVHEKFGLAAGDLAAVRDWIEALRIRFGLDAGHRKAMGLPADIDHTWQAGLDRLFMGYAMSESDGRLVQGILPFEGMEGRIAGVFGGFADFMDKVNALRPLLQGERPMAEWMDILSGSCLDLFFKAGPEQEGDLQLVRGALSRVAGQARSAGFALPVGFEAAAAVLERELDQDRFQQGFLSRGVTCCSLLPMRSIPFRVICLLGMNDGAFPRQTRFQGFDLMAHPSLRRPGDRSRRDDDRCLFMETILSARDALHISYLGRDPRDNSPRHPSVLVLELLEYLEQAFRLEDRGMNGHLVREHRLQPFSPAYFAPGSNLVTHSRRNFAACVSARMGRGRPQAFLEAPLPEPGPELMRLTAGELASFFENPCKYLVNRRLGLFLSEGGVPVQDAENFTLGALDGYRIKKAWMDGKSMGPEKARAMGLLPPGNIGLGAFFSLEMESAAFLDKLRSLDRGEPLKSGKEMLFRAHGVTLDCSGIALNSRGLFTLSPSALSPKYLLRHWIPFLAASVSGILPPGGVNALVFKNAQFRFEPPEDPSEALAGLIALYLSGLTLPLHFFPASSLAFAEKGPDAAASAFHGNPFSRGEKLEPYVELCFGHGDPLDDAFIDAARVVFAPLLAGRKKA